jgi:3-oxoacyl-[acyl-carrier-protein] synthase-3
LKYASLISIGAYVPENILTNSDFEKMVETSDEWITKRTGIKERRVADENESTSDLATNAAKIALERANLNPEDIELIICATISPDYLCMPSTATIVAKKLGCINIPAYDISAACSGFVYALSQAKAYVEAGIYKNILVIGAEKLSAITDYSDRTTSILFGDGAGACVVGECESKVEAILDVKISSDGNYEDILITPGCGSKNPCSQKVIKDKLNFMKMRGNELFKIAVKTLTSDVIDILKENGLSSNDVDYFVPHQANYRIIEAVRRALKFDPNKTILTVHKYGNTSAASIPMAINDAYEEGKIKRGDLMLLDTFGGGLTWGSALVRFNQK